MKKFFKRIKILVQMNRVLKEIDLYDIENSHDVTDIPIQVLQMMCDDSFEKIRVNNIKDSPDPREIMKKIEKQKEESRNTDHHWCK